MRIVAISDTHLAHDKPNWPGVPDGDVLIHAGDATYRGTAEEITQFNAWFAGLPHPHKLFVPGNHDFLFETDPAAARALLDPSITLLQDSGVHIEGTHFWGSPWTPMFFNWAFMLDPGEPLLEKWRAIPSDVDVLITHGPPATIGGLTVRGDDAGCKDLLDEVVNRIRPSHHIFGHIHEDYGRTDAHGIVFLNASSVNVHYKAGDNAPFEFELTGAT